jgi:hypothetical protein
VTEYDDLVKFQEYVPAQLLVEMVESRTSDKEAVDASRTARVIFRDAVLETQLQERTR